MSYLITAGVSKTVEENSQGDVSKVDARILSESEDRVTFDIPGDFSRQEELTLKLCTTLIKAGFYSFNVRHSY